MTNSAQETIGKRRFGARAASAIVATAAVSLTGLATASPARADLVTYCSVLEDLISRKALSVTVQPTDSVNTAVAKVDRLRSNFIKVRDVAPADVRPDLVRIVSNLGRVKTDLTSLKKATGSKARLLRVQIEQRVGLVRGDSDIVEIHASTNCSGDADTPSFDDDLDIAPAPAVTAAPTSRRTLSGTGVYEIGTEILPGAYTTRGGVACRAGQTNDPLGEDPAEGFVVSIGTGVTTQMITTTYRYFVTQNCSNWVPGTRA